MTQSKQTRRQFVKKLGLSAAGLLSSAPQPLSAAQGAAVASNRTRTSAETPGKAAYSSLGDVLYCFDFGGDFQIVAPGFQPVSRVYRSPRYLWVTNVTEITRIKDPDPLLRDFVQGPEGEFWVGLDNGDYEITLILADSMEAHGPSNIYFQDRCVKSGVVTKPGQVLKFAFPVKVLDQKLKLRLRAEPGRTFLLNGLIIQGPPHKAAQRMFKEAPPDSLPSVEEVLLEGDTDCRSAFRRCCDWLLKQRLPNGFIGDFEHTGQGASYWWYTASFPIRAWLAGYEIFQDPVYLNAAVRILDEMVKEQLPNGGWEQTYRNKPTRELSRAEIDDILKHHWVNTADIGSAVTALAVACHYASQPRKQKYLEAAKLYCDHWASRWQLPSGGFTNGLENGVPQTTVYSVATGTEAAAFAAVYAISHEAKYLERAQRAAEFLLDHWQPDGRPICFPDPSEDLGQKYVQPVTQFGDIYYYIDGLLFVSNQTQAHQFRQRVGTVLGWLVNGERGLLGALEGNPWWPLQDCWDNSKSAGMPQAFLASKEAVASPGVERAIGLAQRFLCSPKFAQRIGVMVDDPDLPWGGHSLQSWAGCSVATTAFAGLTLAEMIRPGVTYLSQPRKRTR